MSGRFAASLVLALSLSFAVNASAFRTASQLAKFSSTERVRWSSNSVSFDLVSTLPPEINAFDFSREFVRAFQPWSSPGCSGFSAQFGELTEAPATFGDGRNSIQMVSSGWKALGYAENAAGATDIRYAKQADSSWAIVEADIYINAESFKWTAEQVAPDGYRTLFSVLMHEGGHALGLLHPCEESGEGQAPQCSASGIRPRDSVMYPVYDPSQSALTADDTAGVCFLYRKCEAAGCPDGFECSSEGCMLACPSDHLTGRCTTDQICSKAGCLSIADCAATNCLKKNSCATDSDCELGQYCDSKSACQTGERAFGDVCTSSHDCANGECVEAGYCVPACENDAGCAVDASCKAKAQSDAGLAGAPAVSAASVRGACIGPEKPLGEACTESNECLGGECLSGADAEPVCTRRCGEGYPACSEPWACREVKGRSVCVPLSAPSGGCSVTAQARSVRPSTGNVASWLGATVIFGFLLRVTRRRSPHQFRRKRQQ
jgi:hypothetical protein